MSHELRTPLNSVIGFAQLLSAEPLNENQRVYINQIVDGGKLLLQLVNDVLDLAKIESNKTDVNIESVYLESPMQKCIDLLTTQARKASVSIKQVCRDGAMVLQADPLRLKQVIINLLSNAIKYNRCGGEVIISCEPVGDAMLRIKVEDTGVGIDPDKSKELFQPFSRLSHKNSNIEGVGIGLVVTKKLVEAMHGRIDFSSKLGEGTTFWVDLPMGGGGSRSRERR